MASISITRTHPLYEDWKEAAEFLWASYEGGRAYLEAGMLDQYPRELAVVFEARKERSYILNFMAAVVDSYISSVYKVDPLRDVQTDTVGGQELAPAPADASRVGSLSPVLTQFLDDATGSGTDLTTFMREAMTFALAAERVFVGVDVRASGRPYVHLIHPANLKDFAQTDEGELLWALVAETRVEDASPFEARVESQVYRLWLPDEWIVFDKSGSEINRGRNPAGVVPVVPVTAGNVNLPSYDIARICKRIYNLCSQLDEILINVTFPQMYIQGEGIEDAAGDPISPDTSAIAIGTARMLELPEGASIPPGFLAPPNDPATIHIEERDRLISAIYSLAGLQRNEPDSLKAQSGIAKAYDFKETNSRLVSLAQAAEQAEYGILSVLSSYGVASDINITYQKDFHVEDFSLMLDDYIKLADAPLPGEVKRRYALELSEAVAEEATEEEKKKIREAVNAMLDSEFTVSGGNPSNQSALAGLLNGGSPFG